MLNRRSSHETSTPTGLLSKIQAIQALRKYRDFRYLWVSNFCFFTGNWMQVLVMGWLTYELTGSALLLALFTTARLLPMILGPVGGLLADRMDRVRLLLFLQVIKLLVTVALTALVATGRIEFWHLVVAGLLLGLSHSPAQPVRNTLIMDIVGKEDVSNAIALNAIAVDITRIVGPAVGGLLIARVGAAAAIGISGLWFLVAGASLLPILNTVPRIQRVVGAPLQELWEGFRIVLGNRDMAAVLSISLSANIFVWPTIQAFMPVFAKDVLDVGPGGLGLLLTAMGVGALIGAICIASLGDFSWKGHLYVWGTAAFGIMLALFALSNWFPMSLVLAGLAGFANSAFSVMQAALMLILAPPEFRGRAMGVQMLAIGILPLATIVQGAIANVIGVPLTTAISGFLLAVNMVFLFIWLPSLRRLR